MKLHTALLCLAAGATSAFSPSLTTSPRQTSLNAVLNQATGQSQLDPAVIDRYSSLAFPADSILAEYVWVDAVGNTRSKTRTLPAKKVSQAKQLVVQ